MSIQTGAGVKFFIADETTAQTTADGYAALTWTEIEQVSSIGTYGDSTAEVSITLLGDARVQKRKGSADAGNLTVTMALDVTTIDSSPLGGQGKLLAAADNTQSATNYNFKILMNDGSTTSPESGTTRYFAGQVASWQESIEGPDEILMATSEIRINSAFVRVGNS